MQTHGDQKVPVQQLISQEELLFLFPKKQEEFNYV
jgi:hypothetical protein